uniref:Uncharacterized protein n=1 Tax=Anguilla anguilla TaxID=7936 RepID=A0A0E9XLY3_ANGAN
MHSTQLLVQAMVTSRLDYCNSLLASPPACAIQPLQMIQNAAVCLQRSYVLSHHSPAEVTPLATDRRQDQVQSPDPCLHCSQKDSSRL